LGQLVSAGRFKRLSTSPRRNCHLSDVIPANAGIHFDVAFYSLPGVAASSGWIPAFAGMTNHLQLRLSLEAKERLMQRERIPCVYILASGIRGTLYVGVTSNLPGRIWQHKNDQAEGFTRKYRIHTLVWYEVHGTMESAILREKSLKAWKRAWKLELIETSNPEWRYLYIEIY
jgi:putative endonuclease